MKKDMDKIQFEYRYEVQELMKVIVDTPPCFSCGECQCDRCCDVDSSDNFLFEEKKVK